VHSGPILPGVGSYIDCFRASGLASNFFVRGILAGCADKLTEAEFFAQGANSCENTASATSAIYNGFRGERVTDSSASTRASLLLVHDDSDLLDALTRVFEARGYEVAIAATGFALLARLDSGREYDAIIAGWDSVQGLG